MLETCSGGPRPIRLCVEKTKNFDQIQPPWTWRTCPTCLKPATEALGLLGCVLKRLKILIKFNHRGPGGKNGQNFDRPVFPKFEACSGGPRPIRLCVEKTKNFDQIQPPWTWRTCPTCLKPATEALGLLGCVLKRLKILIKFNHRGPGGKNGQNFDRPVFPKFEAP